MNKKSSRSVSISSMVESLESRTLLCGTVATAASATPTQQSAIEVAAKPVKKSATKTTLSATAGTLGQPVTFTVTVRAAAAAGSPAGTVNIVDHKTVLQSVTLIPTTSPVAKYAYSEATYTLTQPPGGSDYFFGKHPVSAQFIPSGLFNKSSGGTHFTVSKPTYTPLPDGAEFATVIPGSGPAIAAGQTANVLYTGYLARNGKIFDDSINDGGTPFTFTVEATPEQVIAGFDEGAVGMQVGETRLVYIPPAEGYGKQAAGSIPKNSTLIFVLTLESIS